MCISQEKFSVGVKGVGDSGVFKPEKCTALYCVQIGPFKQCTILHIIFLILKFTSVSLHCSVLDVFRCSPGSYSIDIMWKCFIVYGKHIIILIEVMFFMLFMLAY